MLLQHLWATLLNDDDNLLMVMVIVMTIMMMMMMMMMMMITRSHNKDIDNVMIMVYIDAPLSIIIDSINMRTLTLCLHDVILETKHTLFCLPSLFNGGIAQGLHMHSKLWHGCLLTQLYRDRMAITYISILFLNEFCYSFDSNFIKSLPEIPINIMISLFQIRAWRRLAY